MNICYLYLTGALSGKFLLLTVPAPLIHLPMLDILSSGICSRRTYLYIGLVLVLIISGILIRSIERVRNKRIREQVERLHRDILTKITHEFRTPLTIILGLSKQLREQKELGGNNSLIYLKAIERQGKYLSELVNQLLEVANLYMADRTIEWKTGNIVAFMEMISETLRLQAGQKEIELYFFSTEKVIETDFVPDYLNKILQNLLSNAIKYSGEGSRVYLILERDKRNCNRLIIKIIDHGEGICKEVLPHIFDLFYKGPYEGEADGNGVGLTLAKKLTEILGGTIGVETEVGRGSTFTVQLSIRKNEKQLFPHWKPEKSNFIMPVNNNPEKGGYEGIFLSESNENDPRTAILVAEDNKDIALYIRSIFPQSQYNIIYASNGEKAWELMKHQQLPDIVITDMIMPKKSGIELCREMKTSPLLNHIPVIIISSVNKETGLIEGLKSGADSYIRKPFHPEELQICVENLLGSRQLLKEKYHRTVLKEEKIKTDNSYTDFLRHVTDIIYREMRNAEFTPAKLAQELAISISQLNKKLNAATGYPTSVYILMVKLDYAKKILSSQDKTIGEVAGECGIFDVNYFSRVFKKYNGITPTQFKRLPPKTSSLNMFAY